MTEISVIVPSYNSPGLADCLRSLLHQEMKDYEVIVVDSGPNETPGIGEDFSNVKLIRLQTRVFPGEARNIGIKNSSGNVIVFIDSDCTVESTWLKKICSHIGSANVVGGSVANGSTGLVSWADHFLTFSEFLPGTQRQWKAFVPTCNVAYRKEVFQKYGLFPPEQRASEDVFFNTIVSRTDAILFEPEIVVFHKSKHRFLDFLGHQYLLGKNAADVRLKRKDIYGSFLTRSIFWAFLLPFIRGGRITIRILRFHRDLLLLYLLVFPLLMLGLTVWSAGFGKMVSEYED